MGPGIQSLRVFGWERASKPPNTETLVLKGVNPPMEGGRKSPEAVSGGL